MRTAIALLGFAALALAAAGAGRAADSKKLEFKSLSRVTLPKEKGPALKALMDWLDARELEARLQNDRVVLKRGGLVYNLVPLGIKDGIDRLWVFAVFLPRDDFRGSPDLERQAMRINRVQNLFQVYINASGELIVSGNITFCDELSARVFDRYLDLFAAALRQQVLTPDMLKMIK